MMKLKFLLFLVSTVSAFALYCPNCGTHNKAHWRHCVGCGDSLEEARRLLNSKKGPNRTTTNQNGSFPVLMKAEYERFTLTETQIIMQKFIVERPG